MLWDEVRFLLCRFQASWTTFDVAKKAKLEVKELTLDEVIEQLADAKNHHMV